MTKLELVKVEEKRVETVQGMPLLVQVLTSDDYKEGFISFKHCYEVLGMTQSAMSKRMERAGLSFMPLCHNQINSLKEQKVIPLRANAAKFITKETFKRLVKLIDTPEANAIYNSLWDLAEAVHEVNPEDMTLEQLYKLAASKEKARADKAEKEVARLKEERENAALVTDIATRDKVSWAITACAKRNGGAYLRGGIINRVKAAYGQNRRDKTWDDQVKLKKADEIIEWLKELDL